MVRLRQVGVGDSDGHIHLAALQLGTNAVTEVKFSKAQLVGQLHLKVELLAVEGLDFDHDFLGIVSLLGNAVARHGTNHR